MTIGQSLYISFRKANKTIDMIFLVGIPNEEETTLKVKPSFAAFEQKIVAKLNRRHYESARSTERDGDCS